tara:strand:+ start:148219 stop:149133 length:915 start_codon:yes stop_codon:yes gene_type:complete
VQALFLQYLYPISVSFVAFLLYLIGNVWISRKKNRRITGFRRKEISDPIGLGDTPDEIDDEKIQALGIDSIKGRFLFIQRAYPIFIGCLWITLLITPYLSKLPAIYISLIVAIVSLVLGVAIRPFVENIMGGVVISLFQPVRVGDTVRIDGHYGIIEQINLTHCVLRVWDWKRFVIPNSKMMVKEIQNHTMHDELIWTHITFYVEPECDLDIVEALAREAAFESEFKVPGEQPTFWVTDMQKDSVQCWLAVWAPNPPDGWELRCDVRKRLHKKFRQNKIAFQNFRHNSRQYPVDTENTEPTLPI